MGFGYQISILSGGGGFDPTPNSRHHSVKLYVFGKNMVKCYVFGKKYLHLQMSDVYIQFPYLHIIRASPGGLPGLPAGEGTPSRQANTGGRHPRRPDSIYTLRLSESESETGQSDCNVSVTGDSSLAETKKYTYASYLLSSASGKARP